MLMQVLLFSACRQEKHPDITEEEFAERKKQLVEVNKILVKKDRQRIIGYIDRQGWDMKESDTGLWYEIEKKGEGEPAKEGKYISLDYTLSLLDGTLCYSSAVDGVKSFRIGRGGVESGLEEAVLMLNQGGKGRFILSPHLAHGLPGDGNKIPPRAILIYSIEVLSIE